MTTSCQLVEPHEATPGSSAAVARDHLRQEAEKAPGLKRRRGEFGRDKAKKATELWWSENETS